MEKELSQRRLRQFLVAASRARKSLRPRLRNVRNDITKGRLGKIEESIVEILDAQRAEAGAISELNQMISRDFQVTREELELIEKELEKLQKQSEALKDVPDIQLNSIKRRISRVKTAVETLKK